MCDRANASGNKSKNATPKIAPAENPKISERYGVLLKRLAILPPTRVMTIHRIIEINNISKSPLTRLRGFLILCGNLHNNIYCVVACVGVAPAGGVVVGVGAEFADTSA